MSNDTTNNIPLSNIPLSNILQQLAFRTMAFGFFGMFCCGCIGIGATAGVRKSLSKANGEDISGVYGGLHSPMPFGFNNAGFHFNEKEDGEEDHASIALGLSYNLLIGKSDVRHSLMPNFSLTTKPGSILTDYAYYGTAYGGTFGLGVEFGGGVIALQSQACATVRTFVHTHLCGRYSTFKGGWLGTDFNATLPPPLDLLSMARGITEAPDALYNGY